MVKGRSGAKCIVPVKLLIICFIVGALLWTPFLHAETPQGSKFSVGSKLLHGETREPGIADTNDDDDDCSSDHGWSTEVLLHCPPTCRCSGTHVDCSGVGLLVIPPAKEFPPDTVTMDLSGNQLTVFRMTVLNELWSLRELNLSHNHISMIEEAGMASLTKLQTLDISGNRLPCSCPLRVLVSHIAKEGKVFMDLESESCIYDSTLPSIPCVERYVSCVWGPPHHVLHYSLITPDPFSGYSCLALCFRHGYSYYGMDNRRSCLCGTMQDDDDDFCSGVCTMEGNIHMCNKSYIQDFHAVQVTVSLSAPSYHNLLQPAEFHAVASIPVAQFVWEFQDGNKSVITGNGVASHRYSLPGQYVVKVRAEGQQPGAEATVTMVVEVDMAELHCPAVAQTGQSLEVWLQVNQGTNLQAVYSIQFPDGHLLTDDSSCPRGGKVFHENLRCYWLNPVKESLSDARNRCRLMPGGDLAYITSSEQLSFIQESFRSNSAVWVNISQSLKMNVPYSSAHGIQEDCLRLPLLPGEIYQRSPCVEKAPSVCECRAGVHLPDAPVYLFGVPIFNDAYIENATLSHSHTNLQRDIQVMVFPGLWFIRSGSLLALDLGIQPIQHELLARIQILRPFCNPEHHLIPPGCVTLWSPFATCNPQSLCNTTGDCPSGRQWCPLTETCLKLNCPCSTYTSEHYPHPPRYSGIPPSYSPVADVLLQLSPNTKERNIQVQLSHLGHSVHPDDILSIQHTGNQESFLRCRSNLDSPWRQTYARMAHQGWLEDAFLLDSAVWVDNMVCDLRVLYGSELRSLVVSSLLNGLQEDGTYVVSAAISNRISSTVTSCDVNILSPVSDLHIVFPELETDCLNIVTHHPTLVVISAQSSSLAHVQWSTVAQSGESALQQQCPSDVSSKLPACTATSLDIGFSWMWLSLDHPQITKLTILVTNKVSAINLTMPIQSYDAIQGLSVDSDGPDHVILNQTRIFSAKVMQGSSVTFTWTIDNNEGFTYVGTSYVVTFRTPGVYCFKLFAKNPVSSQEKEMVLQISLYPGKVLPSNIRCISSPFRLNHNAPVILYGECDTCHNDTLFSWSAVDSLGNPLTLDGNTTTTGPGSPELIIRRGVLQNYLAYTFYLRVSQPRRSEWGESSITLAPNKPPTGGKCSVLPQQTILGLETLLEYNCTGWRDPDSNTQLFYSLSVGLCSDKGFQKLHLYRGLKSQYSVRPPIGSKFGEIQVFVEVEDVQGARTMAINRTLSISVSPGISMAEWLRNYSGSILEHMNVVGDTPLVIQLALEMVTATDLGDNITEEEHDHLRLLRNNVTHAVSSVQLSSLWEVAAVSAALTQCMGFHHDLDMPVWLNVLNATEKMIHVLNERIDQGQGPGADVPQNILTVLGGALAPLYSDVLSLTAFNLTRALSVSLGRSRVQGEDPLLLTVPGVRAQVTRVPTTHPLCSAPLPLCQTSKAHNLSHTLTSHHELLKVSIELEDNPFPGGLPPNLTISSQLAALEFTSIGGEPVPVKDLPEDSEIQLTLPIKKEVVLNPTSAFIPPMGSASITLTTSMAHESAGIHLHISFQVNESDWSLEKSPEVLISYGPKDLYNNSDMQSLHMLKFFLNEKNSQNLTLLLPRTQSGSLLEYQISITSLLSISSISVSVGLFSSLCQYFHVPSLTWRTDGMSPSNASLPHQAVCLAQHLTLFGASLFVPPHQLVWLSPSPRQWTLALLCCSVLLSLYLLLVLIMHKLDHVDLSRVGTIPLCGPQGQYRYWVLVKTGWRKGAGTTAHVGICLYGLNKSGARHLNSRGGLSTGSMDMFQVETDTNLGEIWKIRVWHDNTGLDPSWFLQYVAVWDKQTDFLYFFLVNDWLSVEHNGGKVEKEILATCPQEVRSFAQVFPQQLFLGITDWHLWLSVWWRPAHSRFTRVQRATCCALALHLYMTICSLWYGAIGIQDESSVVGLQSLVTWESIFIGILVSVMVLPVQLLFSFLFRETRSLVFVEDSPTSTQSTEQDMHMDTSSLLSIPGKADSLLDISSLSCASISSSKFTFDLEKDGSWFAERSGPVWMSSCESLFDTRSDILKESEFGFMQPLSKERNRLGFLSSCSSEDDPLSLSEGSSSSPHFTFSEENLLQSIAADTQVWKRGEESDSGRFSPRPGLGSPSTESGYSLMTENEEGYMTRRWSGNLQWSDSKKRSYSTSSSCVSDATSNESELQECWDIPSPSPSPFTTRIGVRWKPLGWLFPPWMLWVVYMIAFTLLAACVAVTILYTSSLSEHGFFLWLISCTCALLASAFLLEPLKVVLLSLYNALYRPPVLSEGMGLVEEPLIRKIMDHSDKVRAPGGFSLQQAKEEARRVRALRSMIKSCTGHMVFLLLVLLMYFHISFHHNNIRLLHSAIKRSITNSANFEMNKVQSASDFWRWAHITLPAHLHQDRQLTLLRSPRLCHLPRLPSYMYSWTPAFTFPPNSEPCTNFTVGLNFSIDHSSILQVEITQYHKDVGLYISTVIHLDLSPYGSRTFRMSILPFHLEKPGHGLNLPMALAFSLLLASLLFLYPELAALVGLCSSCSSYSPHCMRLVLGLASAATGLVHIGRVWLTKHRMEQYEAKPWMFISLYDVALLSRAQVALSATLLLLIMVKAVQQFLFVRRWAVFVKTFQSLRKELPGLVLIAAFLMALTHFMNTVTNVLLPALSISCSKFSDSLWNSWSFWSIIKCMPCLGWLGLSVLLVCRGLLCGSVLTSYRCTRAECYRLALEPQDYEMIDFFVKRFKLWLGVNKVKEYRHSVKFKGMDSFSTRPSPASSHIPPKTKLVHPPPPPVEQDLFPPNSPRPVLSPAVAVEHLPRAISDLLDRMDKVTLVQKEVSTLEQRLKLWQIMQKSTKPLPKETSTSTLDKQVLPRTSSTFSESALTRIKARIVKSNSYKFSRWGAPINTVLPRHPASAGLCGRARMPTIGHPSEDGSGGLHQNEDLTHPFPLKRKAWDSEKPGGLCHSPSANSIKGSILS
ncbi:polycystin-1-like [Pyxicephalus adspersus]|uniref:polycystin-1-like n=1 Tax=Pyxicephalus adspersus TaxID=30357 RepID=UPI003B5915C4